MVLLCACELYSSSCFSVARGVTLRCFAKSSTSAAFIKEESERGEMEPAVTAGETGRNGCQTCQLSNRKLSSARTGGYVSTPHVYLYLCKEHEFSGFSRARFPANLLRTVYWCLKGAPAKTGLTPAEERRATNDANKAR